MSFVTVKYADNQAVIFNHNCKNGILLGHIKQRCGINPTDSIDLSDERGYVKQLHYNPEDYGTDYLRNRETLILLKVNSSMLAEEDMAMIPADDNVTYTPLLDELANDSQFLGQLNPKASKNSKRRSQNKKATTADHQKRRQ